MEELDKESIWEAFERVLNEYPEAQDEFTRIGTEARKVERVMKLLHDPPIVKILEKPFKDEIQILATISIRKLERWKSTHAEKDIIKALASDLITVFLRQDQG